MTDEIQIYEQGGEVTQEEVALFEVKADAIISQVEEIAAEAREQMFTATTGYKIVDLRGKFCSRLGNWGTSTKNLGVIGHYNGPAVPSRAWSDPIAWIKFINDLHNDPGRFAPNWTFDGIAYCEWILNDTVYLLRDFGAKLPHCGNTTYNAGALGLHMPFGTGQRPGDMTLRTFFARVTDHLKVMKLSRAGLRGHREVGSSACPGDIIQSAIGQYRAGQNPGGVVTKPSPNPTPPKPFPTPKEDPSDPLYTVTADGKQTGVYRILGHSEVGALSQVAKDLKTHDKVTITRDA